MSSVTFNSLFVTAGIAMLSSGAHANNSDERWSSGFGQGVCEAIVTSGAGNQIYFACDCGSDVPSSISFELAGENTRGDLVFLSFDGDTPKSFSLWNGGIPSDCRACADTFDAVKDGLKQHSSVRVMFQNGDAATFTLRGSSAAIGECQADFWK